MKLRNRLRFKEKDTTFLLGAQAALPAHLRSKCKNFHYEQLASISRSFRLLAQACRQSCLRSQQTIVWFTQKIS